MECDITCIIYWYDSNVILLLLLLYLKLSTSYHQSTDDAVKLFTFSLDLFSPSFAGVWRYLIAYVLKEFIIAMAEAA